MGDHTANQNVHHLVFGAQFPAFTDPLCVCVLCIPPGGGRRAIIWPAGYPTKPPVLMHVGTAVRDDAVAQDPEGVWDKVGVYVARLKSGNRAPDLLSTEIYKVETKPPLLIRPPARPAPVAVLTVDSSSESDSDSSSSGFGSSSDSESEDESDQPTGGPA